VLCAVGTGPGDIRAQVRIPTGAPAATLARAVAFFREQPTPVAAVGIASFGPVDLDPRSATFGFITTTPKPGWAHTDVAGPFRESLGVPVGFDTDVNGAALGEHRWGAAPGVDPLVYVTVGTGIGGGAVVNGRLLHGLVHPEMGHLRVRRDRVADPFPGRCPYHGDCLDGLASGRALRERWGAPAETLPADHPAWTLETEYLALGLASIVAVLSPRRLVVGGGVMQQPALLPRVRRRLTELLAGYVRASEIVPPSLGADAGVIGALALAHDALARHPSGAGAE
jgi:fructokinase